MGAIPYNMEFQLSDLKEMKKDLGNYTDNSDQYIQDFITKIQTYVMTWNDVMHLPPLKSSKF
jgi:hypothetical protein